MSGVQKATAVSTVVTLIQGEPAARGNAGASCLAARDRSRRYSLSRQLIAVVQHGAADWSSPRCMCSSNQAAASEPQYPARCAHSQCVSSIVSGGCQCIAESLQSLALCHCGRVTGNMNRMHWHICAEDTVIVNREKRRSIREETLVASGDRQIEPSYLVHFLHFRFCSLALAVLCWSRCDCSAASEREHV